MTNEISPLRRETFEGLYAAPKAPWDIGRPQTAFVEAGVRIQGRVIDIGWGPGDVALWLADQACAVTGVDFLPKPLEAARRKAAERALAVTFMPMDATAVGELPDACDAVTDCGLLHGFDDAGRKVYVAALTKLPAPGARLFLFCFSDAEPGTHGPRRVSEQDLRSAFAEGGEIESIEPPRFESVAGIPGAEFTPDGPRAWCATIRRVAVEQRRHEKPPSLPALPVSLFSGVPPRATACAETGWDSGKWLSESR